MFMISIYVKADWFKNVKCIGCDEINMNLNLKSETA